MKYFYKFSKWMLLLILLTEMSSCNETQLFEEEMYKNVLALVSDDANIFAVVHDLDSTESTGYVAASVGGTNPTETDINVTLKQDRSLFDRYNKSNFDVDIEKFANLLAPAKYDIDNYNFTIPAGKRSGRVKIRIRPDGLSPDSVYFISLKVDRFSAYEANPDKSDVLYRVLIKNKYATQESTTNYSLRGIIDGLEVPGVKPMHPISKNKVRIMAGNIPFPAGDVAGINRNAIVLEIGNDNRVHISSYKSMQVEQIDGDTEFPNIFKVEDDGFKVYRTFLLRYSYKDGAATKQMKEELRLEIKEDELDKFLNR